MKNKNFILCVVFFIFGIINWQLGSMMFSPEIEFEDVDGDLYQLKLVPNTNYFFVPWIDDWPYSKRTLEVMEKVPEECRLQEIPIFTFYLNPISNEQLSNHPAVFDSYLIHSSARQDLHILKSLQEDLFEPSDFIPGDLYFVDTEGDVTYISARDMDSQQIYEEVLQSMMY